MFHYTNDKGYKAIGSQQTWLFKASKPPGDHPTGAYFTKRLFVRGCADKITYVFCFSGGEDLRPLEGGRGAFVFYSVDDYPVEKSRQGPHGLTEDVREHLA